MIRGGLPQVGHYTNTAPGSELSLLQTSFSRSALRCPERQATLTTKGDKMRRLLAPLVLGLVVISCAVAGSARAQNMKTERAEHPRIARAIRALEDAIQYMEAAPHDFGGHKAAAIASSRQAVVDLRQALAYRAMKDQK